MESSYSETQCEVRTTPLRAFNANIAVIYVTMTIVAIVVIWFSTRKSGPATFDTNVYRLTNRYIGNLVVPPAGAASMVNMSTQGIGLVIVAALLIGAFFHVVYALDCRRLYTLLLVDRCNGMRWAQFALIHTLIAVAVAQLLGSTTFDFLWFCLLALPVLGVLGFFADRSYPCCPKLVNTMILGTALILIAYWVPVMTNFTYRALDAANGARAIPSYMWIALFSLLIFDVLVFAMPFFQARQRVSYFLIETMHTLLILIITVIILACVAWALCDQQSTSP